MRNVLHITIEKLEGVVVNMDINLVKKICRVIDVKDILDTQGYQVSYRAKILSLELTLKPTVNPINLLVRRRNRLKQGSISSVRILRLSQSAP